MTEPSREPSIPDGPSAAELELRRGLVAGVSAYVLWGFLTVYWKGLRDFDAFELIGYRIVFSALLLVGGLAIFGRLRPLLAALRDGRLRTRITLAALLLTANWTAYVWAVVHGHVIETALGYFMAPLGTMLIGAFVLHEPLRLVHRVVIGLAFASVAVLTFGYGKVPIVALILAATWSTYGLLKKQVPLDAFESLAAETMVLVVPAALVVAVKAFGADSIPATADTGQLVLVALTGFVTTVPLLLFAHAAQRVPLTVLGPIQYIVPTINFVLGWLVYDEEMTPTRIAGFALVWLALVLLSVDTVNRARSGTVRSRLATSRS
jgi:chloramphenicol-sensitive protein RarD